MYIKRTSFGPHPLGEPPCAVSKAGKDGTVFPMCALPHVLTFHGARNCLNPEGSQPLAGLVSEATPPVPSSPTNTHPKGMPECAGSV